MSASNNAKPHPDENVLTAFAEQTLPQAERDSVFSHLAGCSQCREVLFLAQEASTATEEESKAAMVPAAARRLHWRTPAFAALAIAVIAGALSFWEYQRHARPAVPQLTNEAKSIAPLPPAAAGAAKEPVALSAAHRELQAKSEPKPPRPNRPKQPNPSVSEAELTPAPMIAGPLTAVPSPAGTAQAVNQQQAGNFFTVRSGLVNSPQSPLPPGPEFRLRDGHVEGWDGSQYQTLSLPNGISAVSVAGGARVVLAVERDGAGALYRSLDGGEHWTPVDTQWRGKAISVEVRRTGADSVPRNLLPTAGVVAGNPAVRASAMGRMQGRTPVVFELRNDAGEQWLSADQGKTWHSEGITR
jgi:hypothetical protein